MCYIFESGGLRMLNMTSPCFNWSPSQPIPIPVQLVPNPNSGQFDEAYRGPLGTNRHFSRPISPWWARSHSSVWIKSESYNITSWPKWEESCAPPSVPWSLPPPPTPSVPWYQLHPASPETCCYASKVCWDQNQSKLTTRPHCSGGFTSLYVPMFLLLKKVLIDCKLRFLQLRPRNTFSKPVLEELQAKSLLTQDDWYKWNLFCGLACSCLSQLWDWMQNSPSLPFNQFHLFISFPSSSFSSSN